MRTRLAHATRYAETGGRGALGYPSTPQFTTYHPRNSVQTTGATAKLTRIALGEKVLEIDFGAFKTKALCIPWGDISTAWRSTGIPNIEVYTGATDKMISNAKRSNYLNWLLRMRWVKNIMLKQIDKKPAGPSDEKREGGRSFLWGKVWDSAGKECSARLETMSGYSLTAQTAFLIAEKILAGNFKPGYQTPAMAYGADLIMEVPTTRRTDN